MALNAKQEIFKEEYLKTFNAGKAAIAAGYSDKSARKSGHQLLRLPEVQSAIRERIKLSAIGADEMLALLSEQATGDIGDFLKVEEDGSISLDISKGNTKIIKKITSKRVVTNGKDEATTTTTTVSIELYDAQTAIKLLGQRLGMFRGDATDDDAAAGDWWDVAEGN